MATLDKEIRVIAVKGEKGTDGQDGQDGQDGKSSYELAIENELFSGTLEEWINTFATPENYITRGEFQKVTQAQYDSLKQAGELIPNCYYLIIDSTDAEDFEQALDDVSNLKDDVSNLKDDVSSLDDDVSNLKDDVSSLDDDLIAIANQLNTKKININNGDGLIYGDNEGYLTIEGQNDIEFKYDNDKTVFLRDIFKSIPVNVPIDSSNTKCDIENYGLGLYEVTITKTTNNQDYYYTGLLSIIEVGVKSYVCHIPCGTSSQSIEWVGIGGYIGTILGTYLHEISIGSSGVSLGYTIAKCTRLIKY